MREQPVTVDRPEQSSVLLWLVTLFLGSAALGAWFLIGPLFGSAPYYRVGYKRTTYEYSTFILLLFIPYSLALVAWWRGSRVSAKLLLGGAVFLHVLVLFAPLPQSQDFYQYLFYGRMAAVHGANPFVVSPSVFWADPWFPWIRWNTQTSVYGPVWILLSAGVVKASVAVAGKSLSSAYAGMKLVILALDVGIMASIVALTRSTRDSAGSVGWGLLVYAWNPLVLVTVPIGGSADTAVAAALVAALLARRRGRSGLATVLLSVAALVKAYAAIGLVLHVVLIARERGMRRAIGHAAGGLGLIAAAYAPYWAGLSTFRAIGTITANTNQTLTGTIQRVVFAFVLHVIGYHYWYTGAGVIVRVLAGALMVAITVWAIRRTRDERTLWTGALTVMAAYMLLTPWFLYWYLLAPLAMVAVLPWNRLTVPILVFSGTTFFTLFLPWPPVVWILQSILRYGPPLAMLFVLWRRARRTFDLSERGGGWLEPTPGSPAELETPSGTRLPAASGRPARVAK
jgi:Glycosyltransferase family 87